jgi:glutaryl-CoA dehydrogenase (non-decarboxylating)
VELNLYWNDFVFKKPVRTGGFVLGGFCMAQAKYFAGETAMRCADRAIRILGAYGYSPEYPIARFYRDIPTYVIVEGSANVCKQIIAMDRLGYRKANL